MTGIRPSGRRGRSSARCSTRASWRSWDEPPVDPAPPGSPYADELAAARAQDRVRRGGGDRRGPARRAPGRRGRLRVLFLAGSIGVAAAERLVRAIERATRGTAAAAGRHRLRRHPDAGGRARLRPDGQDQRRGDGAPRRRPAVPRLPAAPHHRRGVRLVGLARPRHRGRAGGARSASSGRGCSSRCTATRSPRACRSPRTCTRTGLVDAVVLGRGRARGRDPRAQRAVRAPARGLDARPRAARSAAAEVEAWEAITRSRRDDRPGVRDAARARRRRRHPAQRHRRGGERPRAAARPGPVRRGPRRRARPGPAAASGAGAAARARPGCGWRGAACGWPPSWGCRWSP